MRSRRRDARRSQKAAPTITTQVPAGTVQLGDSRHSADGHGHAVPGPPCNPVATGTITFTLYGPFAVAPGAQSCTADTAVAGSTRTATVNGNGSYATSPGVDRDRGGLLHLGRDLLR